MNYHNLLDANVNRVREGLRVLEDISRFILADNNLMECAKNIRHNIKNLLDIPDSLLVLSRTPNEDIGRGRIVPKRVDLPAVVSANAKRAEEGLRVLEEFSTRGDEIKEFRYDLYTLEKNILVEIRLVQPFYKTVYAISDDPDILIAAIKVGAKIVQLRDKTAGSAVIFNKLLKIKQLKNDYDFVLIVNDYPELCVEANVDGVHVGQDFNPVLARDIIGDKKILGLSTHNLEQANQALKLKVNYIGCGPVFSTPTKEGRAPVGTAYVRELAAWGKLPFVAIGGINLANVREVLEAGADTVAVVRGAKDVAEYLRIVRDL